MRARLAHLRHRLAHRGGRYECPLCGGTFGRMAPHRGRSNARCPACHSAERHRLLWLFLVRELDVLEQPRAVLHFAPEAGIARHLSAAAAVDYTSADLDGTRAMEAMDITAIPRPDASFDLVLVSHVLEHVPDDARALSEIHRVLRPGGLAVMQHPVDPSRATTAEDPGLATTAEERLRHFGQEDHVRVYGRDHADRLRAAGFDVTVRRYHDELPPGEAERHAVGAPEVHAAGDVYVCRRSG